MYQAFDAYLSRDNWHSDQDVDDEVFHRDLALVIDRPDFDPDHMGDYMRRARGLSSNSQDPVAGVIENRVRDAWAVKTFRRFNEAA